MNPKVDAVQTAKTQILLGFKTTLYLGDSFDEDDMPEFVLEFKIED